MTEEEKLGHIMDRRLCVDHTNSTQLICPGCACATTTLLLEMLQTPTFYPPPSAFAPLFHMICNFLPYCLALGVMCNFLHI